MPNSIETLAGTMPDRQVAEVLGIDAIDVKAWRRDHGVAPFLQAPPASMSPDAPPIETAVLDARRREVVRRRPAGGGAEVVSVREVPAIAPRRDAAPQEAPRRARGTARARLDAVRTRLGQVADDIIAAEVGVTRGVVGGYRREHNIPAYAGYRFEPGHAPVGRPRSTKAMPQQAKGDRDAELGREAGPAARRPASGPAAFERLAPPSSRVPPSGAPRLSAYGVLAMAHGVQREFILVGEDVASVAEHAEVALRTRSDGPWALDALRWLGDGLG